MLKVPLTLIKQPTYLERLPFKKLIVLLQIKLNSVTVDFTAFFFGGGEISCASENEQQLLFYWCFSVVSVQRFGQQLKMILILFRSTAPSRPNKVGLKCPIARPSTKSFFDFSEMWCVGRGRRVMHDGMQYDLIQAQGHEPLKVGNSAIFKGYLLPH